MRRQLRLEVAVMRTAAFSICHNHRLRPAAVLAVIALSVTGVTLLVHGSLVGPSPAEASTALTVNISGDVAADDGTDGDCSLRSAVQFANNPGAGDPDCGVDGGDAYTIQLEDGQTYLLTVGEADPAETGALEVVEGLDVIIEVAGAGAATIEQTVEDRVIHVLDGAQLTLDGITVTGGDGVASGAGILNDLGGSLTLINSTVTGNTSGGEIPAGDGYGGGIHNAGVLVLTASTVSDNEALPWDRGSFGGGLYNAASGTTALHSSVVTGNTAFVGGGIHNDGGDLELNDSTVGGGNVATADGGGGVYSTNDGTVSISDSTISGNWAYAGNGIYIESGSLALVDSMVTNNVAPFGGGGVWNSGSATLTNVVVSGNDGGGIQNRGGILELDSSTVSGNTNDVGGGVLNTVNSGGGNGTVTIIDSTLSDNTAGNGGGIWNGTGLLTLINSTVRDNTADAGGGILNRATLDVNGSTISANTADSGGGVYNDAFGPLTVTSSTVDGNTASADGGGIAIGFGGGSVALTRSTVSNNAAGGNGGGIYNELAATVTLVESMVSGNTAALDGGGMFNGSLIFPPAEAILVGSTVSANTAQVDGGGIRNAGNLSLENSTVSGNAAIGGDGGGVYTAIDNSSEVTLDSTTVTENTALGIGGIFNVFGLVSLHNTIIADQHLAPDCGGPAAGASLGHNLDSDGTCNLNGAGDIPSGIANLGPLQDNGGPTQTHALLAGSDAMDAGQNCPLSDQRGVARPQGAACDIGAYEVSPGDLEQLIENTGLSQGQRNALLGLISQLEALINDGIPGNDMAACTKLDLFIARVADLESNGSLTEVEANDLVAAADAVKVVAGCPG